MEQCQVLSYKLENIMGPNSSIHHHILRIHVEYL